MSETSSAAAVAPAVSAVAPSAKKRKTAGSRVCWAVCVNAKEQEPLGPYASYDENSLHHMVVVKHSGDEKKREHYHYFLHFKRAVTMTAVKMFVKCDHAHCEPVKSTPAYLEYLSDGHTTLEGPYEFGHKVTHGYRSDFERLVSQSKKGWSQQAIYSYQPGLLRYTNAVTTALEVFTPAAPTRRDVIVNYLWGPTGTGKTYRARNAFPNAFFWRGPFENGRTWDEYSGQDVIILDEWTDCGWLLTLMNSICDEWTFTLPARYHNKKSIWNRVILCTNQNPSIVYNGNPTFQRRIGKPIFVELREDYGGPKINF